MTSTGLSFINDTLGHNHGDALLIQVARRLCENTRTGDLVARLGGDEFAIVLSGGIGVSKARSYANQLRGCLRAPFSIDGSELFLTASIGIAFAVSGDLFDAEVLIRDADTAVQQAKEVGRDAVAVYDDSMRAQLTERIEIGNDLRHAVKRHELHLVFQPVVKIGHNEVLGFEALVRWSHPTLGVLPPKQFIPLAEEEDLIDEIGAWVLDDALRQLVICRAVPGFDHLTVAVNLSALQLRDKPARTTRQPVSCRPRPSGFGAHARTHGVRDDGGSWVVDRLVNGVASARYSHRR